jgi:hypothetical protein
VRTLRRDTLKTGDRIQESGDEALGDWGTGGTAGLRKWKLRPLGPEGVIPIKLTVKRVPRQKLRRAMSPESWAAIRG